MYSSCAVAFPSGNLNLATLKGVSRVCSLIFYASNPSGVGTKCVWQCHFEFWWQQRY